MKRITSLVNIFVRAFVVAIALILGAQPTGTAYAATITVNTEVDEDLGDTGAGCSLREAIIAANTDTAYNGCVKGKGNDTISFLPNLADIVLSSNLPDVTSNITFLGPKAPADTDDRMVVDGNGPNGQVRSGFRITTANVSVIRMTFENGFATSADVNGGAISQVGSGTLNIDSSTFFLNSTNGSGGAIYLTSTPSLKIANSTFIDNASGANGGAIYVASGLSSLTLTNSRFISNGAAGSGGVISVGGPMTGKVTISGSTFNGNSTNNNGGVLHNDNSGSVFTLTIAECDFLSGIATRGAVMMQNSGIVSRLSITMSDFADNSAVAAGGAFWLSNLGSVTISSGGFDHNVVTSSTSTASGGVLYANALTGGMSITKSHFSNNEAHGGGAIYVGDAAGAKSIQLTKSEFAENQGMTPGGGALWISGLTGSMTISGMTFTDNTGGNGGVLLLTRSNPKNVVITKTSFAGNSGSIGGAIALGLPDNFPGTTPITISKTTFSQNHADFGGAIYANHSLIKIVGAMFRENQVQVSGGAVFIKGSDSSLSVTSSTFADNQSVLPNGTGGAIFADGVALAISKNLFWHNQGTSGSAVWFNTGAFHTNCFQGNSPTSVYDAHGNLDVTGNWWNDPGGPNQGVADTYFSDGGSNAAPWLESRPACPKPPAP